MLPAAARNLRTATWAFLLLLCALLPLRGAWLPVPLAIASVLLLVAAWRDRPAINWRVLWPLSALYILHLIGMAWTDDLAFGLFDLQVKIGLVLLPVVAAAFLALQPTGMQRAMAAFTFGNMVAMALSLIGAWRCQAAGGEGCFSQSTLSFDLHPSYAAWYACWSVAYAGHRLLSGEPMKAFERWCWIASMAALSAFVVLLASKSGVLGMGLVAVWLGARVVMRPGAVVRITLLVAVGLIALAAIRGGSVVMARMQAALDAVELARAGDPAIYTSAGGSEMRLVAWMCSAERIAKDPLGAGTGDIKHALADCYAAKGATPALERKLNSHSQFLQGGVALGWLGLLLTLATALVPLAFALRRRDALLSLFALLFLLNAAVESVLEVQAGVVFYSLMLGLLVARGTGHAHLAGRTDPTNPV
ncbi:MAG: O-antigen ligase family protein [Flavobacteriales bacterium]|nr:O-antigen ligase family protein [Flavobacteriales bacterium]